METFGGLNGKNSDETTSIKDDNCQEKVLINSIGTTSCFTLSPFIQEIIHEKPDKNKTQNQNLEGITNQEYNSVLINI